MSFGKPRQKLFDEASLYEYAIGALGRRMRTVAELKRLLRQKVEQSELGDLLVETVIARLKEQRYLNDTAYATTYSSLRKEKDRFGRRRVITAYADTNEEQLARAFLARKRLKKPASQKEAARVFRTMIRAGFGTRTIITILKKWDVEEDVLTALEAESE
jgi:regulatory protein